MSTRYANGRHLQWVDSPSDLVNVPDRSVVNTKTLDGIDVRIAYEDDVPISVELI